MRSLLAKLFIVAALALPLAATVLGARDSDTERRALAAMPALPANWAQARAYPGLLDTWINDHFGWRARLVAADTTLRYRLFGQYPTIQVIDGREGRLFLAAHNRAGEPYTAIRLACGDGFKEQARIVREVNRFASVFAASQLNARLMIAPSAPMLYNDQLPAWMAARCPSDGAPADAILADPALTPAARAISYFPLADLRALRKTTAIFPLTFFHWSGAGPAALAGASVERFWGHPAAQGTPIPLEVASRPSDIAWLFPGIARDAEAGAPVLARAGIAECWGEACFPELPGVAQILGVMARYHNGAPGLAPRLVLVTDSFGVGIAPWYARYYSEVVLVSTNMLEHLKPADRAALARFLFHPDSSDEVLYLYHDASFYSGRVGTDLRMLSP